MQVPEFDHKQAQWDRWKAFHVTHGGDYQLSAPFVQFDTGEVVCTQWKFKPEMRRVYKDLNVRVVGTNDLDCPSFTTPDGASVLRGWLSGKDTRRAQHLLIDLDTKHVVSLHEWLGEGIGMPNRFNRRATAWFAGVEAEPIGSPVKVVRPRVYTKEERAHVRKLHANIVVYNKMNGVNPKEGNKAYWWRMKPVVIDDKFLALSFDDLTPEQRNTLALKGTTAEMIITEHPYLIALKG
jgi:hypothetical protein